MICFFLVKEIPYKESMLFYVGKLIIYIIICIGLKKKTTTSFYFNSIFPSTHSKKKTTPLESCLWLTLQFLPNALFKSVLGIHSVPLVTPQLWVYSYPCPLILTGRHSPRAADPCRDGLTAHQATLALSRADNYVSRNSLHLAMTALGSSSLKDVTRSEMALSPPGVAVLCPLISTLPFASDTSS